MSVESKTAIYNRMMSTRDELNPGFVVSASEEIQRRVLLMEEYRTVLRVGLYAPYGNEVRTEALFTESDKHRKEIYCPALNVLNGTLAYYRVETLEDFLRSAGEKPGPAFRKSRLRDLNTLGTLVVPGVAFDLSGSRMGLRNGFFDRCLVAFSGRRIALAFDFQVVAELPVPVRGQRVDWIVTEKRIIRC